MARQATAHSRKGCSSRGGSRQTLLAHREGRARAMGRQPPQAEIQTEKTRLHLIHGLSHMRFGPWLLFERVTV